MIVQSVAADLKRIVGPDNVLLDEPSIEYYSVDAYGRWRGEPLDPNAPRVFAVARPGSTEEVADIVRLACRESFPVIPYGGGTGVAGAVTPLQGGMAVDLKRMNRILEISPADRTATVEAGVILGDLNDALGREGFMLGHDPYSVPIATVGGAISTNGVGYRAAKYGPMGQQVLGLEVVLPNGETINTKSVPKTSGPSLHPLFIGAEGVLGVITRATLRVFRLPESRVFKSFTFPSFEDGFQAMLEMFSLGLRPALIDVSEEPHHNADGYDESSTVMMYLVFEGYAEEVEAQVARTLKVCLASGGNDVGPDPARRYWDTRHDSAYSYKERFLSGRPAERPTRGWPRTSDYPHVAIPASKVLEYRSHCRALAAERGLQVREYSLWTQPELFSMILVDVAMEERGEPGQLRRTSDEVLSMAQDIGGSMEYVHGVGTKLVHLAERELEDSIEALRAIKAALDPNCIMNPGKLGL